MTIKLRLFGVLRELVGQDTLHLDLPPGATTGQLLSQLSDQYPPLRQMAAAVAVSVNLQYASQEVSLKDGDEVALIPPVSGGGLD